MEDGDKIIDDDEIESEQSSSSSSSQNKQQNEFKQQEQEEEEEHYYQDKELDQDTPLNKSLKQLSTQHAKKNKILYTLWFLEPEWIDTQNDSNDDNEKELKLNQKRILNQMIHYSTQFLKFPLTLYRNIGQQSTRQSNLSPLHNHNINQPTSKLLSSYDGSILASTENTTINFRSLNDNFSTIQKRWNYIQNDKEAQWQRMCFSPDNLILAFSTSGCTIYIISIEDEQTLHILSPKMIGLNPNDGIADLSIRNAYCDLDINNQKCYELLILGYDMILRRFHIPIDNQSFSIHSFSANNSNDDSNRFNNGCQPMNPTTPLFKQVHHSVGCMVYSPSNDILAIGGNRKSKRGLKAYVSFWKLSDQEPFYTLLNPINPNLKDIDQSVSEQQQQQQQVPQPSFIQRLKFSILGNYLSSVVLHKVVFSNNGTQLLSLDLNGTISLWNTPADQDTSFKPILAWSSLDLAPVWETFSPLNFTSTFARNVPGNGEASGSGGGSSAASKEKDMAYQKMVIDVSWWSDNEIIMVNRLGQFCIYSVQERQNSLLHDPEMVSSSQPPILTSAHNGRFFILETSCTVQQEEQTSVGYKEFLQSLKRPLSQKYRSILRYFNGGDVTDDNDEDPFHFTINHNAGSSSNSNELTTAAVGNKRKFGSFFSMGNKKKKSQEQQQQQQQLKQEEEEPHFIRRIVKFQSTTPEQLFKTKVSQKEYGNALLIAEHYGLDKDLVHQKRWIRQLVSQESIHLFLSKVQDINWVLWSSHIRVPLNFDSTKLLLQFALDKTSTLIQSSNSIEKLKENKIIILQRNIIINYLNRLKTYQEIYGSDYDAKEFLYFRDCNLISAAMEYASLEYFKAVEILFTYYGKLILPFRLDILSSIPETTSPNTFKSLLPDQLNMWSQKKSFEEDWSQSKEIYDNVLGLDYNQRLNSIYLKSMIHQEYEDIRGDKDKDPNNHEIDLYSIDYNIKSTSLFTNGNQQPSVINSNRITKWYINRAQEIDKKSGQIDHSLLLVNIGIEKNVDGLQTIQKELKNLNSIVYDSNMIDISLEHYQSCNELQRLELLLHDVKDSNIYQLVMSRKVEINQLLVQFFEAKSKQTDGNGLELVKSFLYDYLNQDFNQRLLLEIGLNSIEKAVINQNNIQIMLDILNNVLPCRSSVEDSDLFDKKDFYKQCVEANQILLKYQLEKPISYFQQHTQTKSTTNDEMINILNSFFKYAKRQKFTSKQWKSSLGDLLDVKRLLFHSTMDTQVYYLFVKNLLSETKFYLAQEYLGSCGSPERIESLLLGAAREIFNSSSSYGHTKNLEDAKICLELFNPPTRKIIRELNLIKAVDLLYSNFQFPKLPVQIRLILDKQSSNANSTLSPKSSSLLAEHEFEINTSNSLGGNDPAGGSVEGRFEIIQLLLQYNPQSYIDIENICKISELLTDWGNKVQVSDRVYVLSILGNFALEKKNYNLSFKICQELIKNRPFNESWKLCSKLALTSQFNDIDARLELLSFAILDCDFDQLSNLLSNYKQLELLKKGDNSNNDDSSRPIVLEPPFIESRESFVSVLFNDVDDQDQDEQRLIRDQLLFRSNQIFDKQDLNLIQELSSLTFKQGDMKSTLSYLFSLDESQSSKIFDQWIELCSKVGEESSQERCTRLACYFFSLSYLLNNSGSDGSLIFSQSIENIITLAQQLKKSNDGNNNLDKDKYVSKYYNSMVDSIQAKELSEIDTFVDFGKFKSDHQYKLDTIFSFAKSNQLKSLQTSISMAKRYSITIDQVLIKHIEWQLFDNPSKPILLLNQQDFQLLLDTPNCLSLIESCYQSINSSDYHKFIYYYSILNHLNSNSSTVNNNKKKLLELLIKNKSSLDFKQLIDSDHHLNPIEQHQILPENINFWSNCISLLQSIRSDDVIQNITLSKIYLAMIQTLIQRANSPDEIFNTILKYKKQLEEVDMETCYKNLILSDTLSVRQRISLTADLLMECNSNGNVDQESITFYQLLESHLISLEQLEGLVEREWIMDYDEKMIEHNFNKTEKDHIIELLIKKCINQYMDPANIYQIYRILSPKSLDHFIVFYQQIVQEKVVDHLDQIQKICHSISASATYQDKDQLKDCICKLLGDYSTDKSNSIEKRMKVLEILRNENMYTNEEVKEKDAALLKSYKTKEIINDIWKDDQNINNNDDHEHLESIPLFNDLLGKSNSFSHLQYLCKLLIMWKTQTPNIQLSECWFKLYQALVPFINNNKDLNSFISIRTDQIKSTPMTEEQEKQLLDQMAAVGKESIMFKFGLLSNYNSVHEVILNQIYQKLVNSTPQNNSLEIDSFNRNEEKKKQQETQQQQEFIVDQQLLHFIFSIGGLYKFVNTTLYKPLLNMLFLTNVNNRCKCNDSSILTGIEYNILQLVLNHHHYQSSSIALYWWGINQSNLTHSLLYLEKFLKRLLKFEEKKKNSNNIGQTTAAAVISKALETFKTDISTNVVDDDNNNNEIN
ncbi:hypothetical protein CYY_004469 [Polysphondylium violaceum]|uniref:Neuroblastoma-amplified sequence N-terminal domain-containing protein n=1 Tax=Polysphondylium violaceum TaxID=133409 RepID=A0A8J4PTA5_9MYCE|nr:hypothetical protein CYY_004469 [Polysphondylium violaceum]